ncbi:MAG TPA: hypothetical protein VFN89_02080 [Solirubrobacterales bacterium]|nr:hypothetical protein [Solirubrobacterales bacterium]
MALSDDQRALLRLLAQREQGYEDIAALKGMSVEDVRAEVREALAAMDTPPPEPPPPPPPSNPEPASPRAEEPARLDPAPAAKPKAAPRPAAGARSRSTVPVERRRIVLIAGGALAIVAIVLGAVAIFSGGSDSGSSSGGGAPGTETAFAESPTATNGKITRAVLEPVDGSEGEGLAVFGRARKQVRLAIAAKGLEQPPSGQAYVVWLANSSNRMVPVTIAEVDESGEIAAQYPIPAAVLVYLAEGAFDEIDLSLVSTARYKAAFSKARKESKLPAYTGTDVLRGKVEGPIVGAAKRKISK